MKRSKRSKPARSRSAKKVTEDVSVEDIDWDTPATFDIDPRLTEAIRSRTELKQITLRIGVEQIAEARRIADQTGVPYQRVLRRWLAEGASLSRSARNAG